MVAVRLQGGWVREFRFCCEAPVCTRHVRACQDPRRGTSVTSTPPAGWYADPTGVAGQYRYWSGSAWTEHIYVAAPPALPQWQQPGPPASPQYMARPEVATVRLEEPTRRDLSRETVFMMVAFLLPGIVGAVVLLAEHVNGLGTVTRFPVYVSNPVANMLLGMLAYLPVACTVPLALFLLYRTGQTPKVLGLAWPGLRSDVIPAIGIIAASWGAELVILIPLAPLIADHSHLVSQNPVGTVPHYYVIWGVMISATTAVAEEVLMNGYLLTRLSQLGWTPRSALILSLVLRTSYHVYYGIGFIATVPVGYFLIRSFQKNGRLTRPIVAHFLFDAILLTIGVLT